MATCIIVDDEPLSRDILRKYIGRVRDLELVGECPDALAATHMLAGADIDIMFLDINMPGLTGISLVRSLAQSPLVIFTTAYPQFAVEGFELDALDYLVKPYSFERFMKAVNRATERLSAENGASTGGRKVMIRADRKLYAVDPGDILYVEGLGDYIKIHLEGKHLVAHDTIKGFTENLPKNDFMRIHKSYVVNVTRIGFIEGNQVKVGEASLPVSPAFREELLGRFSAPG